MKKWLPLILILIFALSSCSQQTAKPTILKLPSGNEVKILGIGKMYIAGSKEWSLMLKYQTAIPLENKEDLRKEVLEVWNLFRINVEKSNLNIGIISANDIAKGSSFFNVNRSYNFLFEKQKDGTWKLVE